MKSTLSVIGLIFLFGCGNIDKEKVIPHFQEKELSFLHLRSGYDKTNNWIKEPSNILMLHETFKKIGYTNLINEEAWESDWNWYLDINKSPKNLIDSLKLTYKNAEAYPEYYQKFWQRRKKEGNAEMVIKVVEELEQIMNENTLPSINDEVVNDTLFNLLAFEFPERSLTNEAANLHLAYLIKIGLHESAYNLISGENGKYEMVNWNTDLNKVLKKLKRTEKNDGANPWFPDDTK